MATISISVPEELEKSMHEFKIDWPDVARRAFIDKTEKLKRLKLFSSKFRLSTKHTRELADRIDKSVADKFFKEAK